MQRFFICNELKHEEGYTEVSKPYLKQLILSAKLNAHAEIHMVWISKDKTYYNIRRKER